MPIRHVACRRTNPGPFAGISFIMVYVKTCLVLGRMSRTATWYNHISLYALLDLSLQPVS